MATLTSAPSMNTSRFFDRTPEEWAALDEKIRKENEAQQQRETALKKVEWMEKSCIPSLFQNAQIDACDQAVKDWSSNPDCDLILEGKVGRGKTYAACAAMLTFSPDRQCLFCQFRDVLEELKDAHTSNVSAMGVIRRYARADILCIDDFGKSKPTDWMLEMLHNIIDKRINAERVTIYTTQYLGKKLAERLVIPENTDTGLAIMSRLAGAKHILLQGDDRRLKHVG